MGILSNQGGVMERIVKQTAANGRFEPDFPIFRNTAKVCIRCNDFNQGEARTQHRLVEAM
jgi:hypothetical protein